MKQLLWKVFFSPGQKKRERDSQDVVQVHNVLSGLVLKEFEACEFSCMAPVKCDYCYLRALCKFMNTV